MEPTFTRSVCAPSTRAPWLTWLLGFMWHYSPRGTSWSLLADTLVAKHRVSSLGPSSVLMPDGWCSRYPGKAASELRLAAEGLMFPNSSSFAPLTRVQDGGLEKSQQTESALSKLAIHSPSRRCLPPALKRSFPLLLPLLALPTRSSSLFSEMQVWPRDRAKKLQKSNSFY